MADDALSCFQSLLDTVPTWLAELQEILKGAAEKQEEILFANKPSDAGVTAKCTPSKTSSLKSRRSTDAVEDNTAVTSNPIRPALRHLTQSDALRLSQRKRKTASIISGESGPSRFRTKYAAVVYYDGDTQKRFETLVRAIGSSRNAIRKGKMSAKVDGLSRSSSTCSESSKSDEEDLSTPLGKTGYRPSRPSGFPAFSRITNDTQAFDQVDGRLEKAQASCERAAHQVLREGDCTPEVSQARDHFTEALRMAKEEIPALERKAKKSAERRRRSEERRRVEEEVEEQKRANDLAVKRIVEASSGNKTAPAPTLAPEPAVISARFANDEVQLEVDDLEVDSDSEGSDGEEFNITSLPSFGKFSAMRNARLGSPVVRL
ncbi:unnamed protein product [Zymoseptoria tritici ST99CH_1E4]|uniref:Uncharacterized protein n=1 Tax=Zymoseptoria tritici ST99CH_1E4 TaxID=1276532 RepID=A0A2H1GYM9_ZYMTR|nr:unnamed protein product [Zymoseptoria tritici ST99CH_1E4]